MAQCQMMPLQVATHSSRLQPSITYLHAPVTALMFGCFGTQIHDPDIRDEGSGHLKTNIAEQTIESISLYLSICLTVSLSICFSCLTGSLSLHNCLSVYCLSAYILTSL